MSNRISWAFVILLASTTVAVTLYMPSRPSAQRRAPLPNETPPSDGPDFSRFSIADYDRVASAEASELERRKRISHRYDNQIWVVKNPGHDTAMIGRVAEETPPPALPTDDSDLIVTGAIVSATAHLSNDKRSVYSEFVLNVDEVLKCRLPVRVAPSSVIRFDRAGGVVRYPNGQQVLYLDSDRDLPRAGGHYLLFLADDADSENYKVLTLYGIQETNTLQLDYGRALDDIKRLGKSDLLKLVRSKLGIDDNLTVTYLGGKEPVRAIFFEVEGERMEFGQRFSAGEDWLKTLTIGIQNTSGKVVTYIDIGVFVPRHKDQNKAPPFHFSLFSGNKQAAVKMEDSGLLFEPSSSPDRFVAVRIGLDEFTSIRSSLSKLGYPSKIGAIELQIEEVVFSDGTVWSLGRWYRSDPGRQAQADSHR